MTTTKPTKKIMWLKLYQRRSFAFCMHMFVIRLSKEIFPLKIYLMVVTMCNSEIVLFSVIDET